MALIHKESLSAEREPYVSRFPYVWESKGRDRLSNRSLFNCLSHNWNALTPINHEEIFVLCTDISKWLDLKVYCRSESQVLLIKLQCQQKTWFCSDLNELQIAFSPKEGTILKEMAVPF